MLGGCFLVKKIAGADIDPVQFEKARQAKVLNVRYDHDITCFISNELINKIARQYENSAGAIDASTTYVIQKVTVSLKNGSGIASLGMKAHSEKYSLDLNLTMDCLIALETVNNELVLKLEPFNITPEVTIGGMFSSADEIVSNLIKINLADMGQKFPPLKIPLNFANQLIIQPTKMEIHDKINMLITSPQRNVGYNLKIKEIWIFDSRAFVAMNVEKVEVR